MKRLAIIIVLVLLTAGAVVSYQYYGRARVDELRLPGTVEIQEVRLGSKVGGRVATVNVQEGQVVEPGLVLVTFETPELMARRDQMRQKLATAQAALDKANHGPLPEEVAEAKAMAEGAKARLDRSEAGFRDEQIKQAQADYEAFQAELKHAEDDYSRVQKLGSSALSKADFDTALASRDRARGRLNSAKAILEMYTRGSRVEDIAEAKAEHDRWQARYRLLKRGTREEDKAAAYAEAAKAQADLAEAETNLREAVVTAPEKCVIEVLNVRPGDLVAAGQPVVRALRAGDLWVKVFVPSTEIGKLRLNESVEVTVDSHPGRRFHGEVLHIAAISEFTPRNVQSADERKHQVFAVKVRVKDPEGVFKSGMAAEVMLPLNPSQASTPNQSVTH